MSNNMRLKTHYFQCISLLFTLLCSEVTSKSLRFSSGTKNIAKLSDAIEKYFPYENNLCLVLAEDGVEAFCPTLRVPVVVFTQEHVLQDCGRTMKDHDGYVFMTSNFASLFQQIVPLLKCFNQTTLKLKTIYILILDLSKTIPSNRWEDYRFFFQNLWKNFGIINIAILPVKDHRGTEGPIIYTFNPFLARDHLSRDALKSTLPQDVRFTMTDRFRNMHGHCLKTVFQRLPLKMFSFKDLCKKQTLGADPRVLFTQLLEASVNASFHIYDSDNDIFIARNGTESMLVGEIIKGRADFCTDFFFLQPEPLLKQIQIISTDQSLDIVFVVPKPRQINSWRYFQYIFQWQVCVGLDVVMFLLSGAALLFERIHSSTSSHNSSRTSEVVSVWKAVCSVSINRLPTTHSQRLLLAWSFLLGLIFVTLFSDKLFALIKSKPRLASIKTMQDLHDSNLPIYTGLKQFSLSQLNEIFDKMTLHDFKDNLKTDKMYENQTFLDPSYLNITDRALIYPKNLLEFLASIPQNKALLKYFEVVKEPIYQSPCVVYLPIGSEYYDLLNNLNLRLISGGFYNKWLEVSNHQRRSIFADLSTQTSSAPVDSHQTDEGPVPLTYKDLKMAFYILYVGLTVSALCFLLEVCYF